MAAIKRAFGRQATIYETIPGVLDIFSPDASKAAMAQQLARRMQIPAEQTMAIGDHDSDATLLQWAGIGVAMGNATPAAKAAADVITSSNLRDGVAEALEQYLLGQGTLGSKGECAQAQPGGRLGAPLEDRPEGHAHERRVEQTAEEERADPEALLGEAEPAVEDQPREAAPPRPPPPRASRRRPIELPVGEHHADGHREGALEDHRPGDVAQRQGVLLAAAST